MSRSGPGSPVRNCSIFRAIGWSTPHGPHHRLRRHGLRRRHIAAEAARRGHEVTSVSRNLPAEPAPGMAYVEGSLLDETSRTKALDGADVVVVAVPPRGDMADTLRVSEAAPRVFETRDFPADYRPESVTMGGVLDDLRVTERLDWFYVSPAAGFGSFNPGEARGTYRLGGDVLLPEGNADVSGADCGLAVVDEIGAHAHRRAHIAVAY